MMQKHLEPSDIPGSWNVQSPVSNSFGDSQTKLELYGHKKSLIQLFADQLIWWILKGELWLEHWRHTFSQTSLILTHYADCDGMQNAVRRASSDMCTHFLRHVRLQWSPKMERPAWWGGTIGWLGSRCEGILLFPSLCIGLVREGCFVWLPIPWWFCLISLWQKCFLSQYLSWLKRN